MNASMVSSGRRRSGDRHNGLWPVCILAAMTLLLTAGCFQPPGSQAATISFDLVLDEIGSGYVYSGQRLVATVLVEAAHTYDLRVSLTASAGNTAGFDGISGEIEGDPLAESVAFPVSFSTTGSVESVTPTVFSVQSDGAVTIGFAVPSVDQDDTVSDSLEAIRALINGPTRAQYELLVTDRGFDDNGTGPGDAVVLAVGSAGELVGTLTPGDEADYFVLQVFETTTYRLTVEATDSVTVTSGSEDRFGQINFGVPTPGGLVITSSASAGIPGIFEFEAPATEQVLLRLTGTGAEPTADSPVQYAISVVEFTPEEEEP